MTPTTTTSTRPRRRRPSVLRETAEAFAAITKTGPMVSQYLLRSAGYFKTHHDGEGTTMVSLDDAPGTCVRIDTDTYRWLVGDRSPHRLTRTRWWLDEDGMVRAYSRNDQSPKGKFTHGHLVAALVLGLKDGDLVHVEDPLDLRRHRIRQVAAPPSSEARRDP